MKVLNLFAGIGGNRKLWEDVEVTAVEIDPEVARVYQEYFPDDTMVIGDAHQYLLDHYKEFDFIWSSPPCPTHSRARFWGSKGGMCEPKYPDMRLYQEIIFLDNYYSGKWIVENVKPYYRPLIHGKEIGRHLFWSNFRIHISDFIEADINKGKREDWQELHGISIEGYKFTQRTDKILRNCVHPETGLHILNQARGIIEQPKTQQSNLF